MLPNKNLVVRTSKKRVAHLEYRQAASYRRETNKTFKLERGSYEVRNKYVKVYNWNILRSHIYAQSMLKDIDKNELR